MTTLLPIHKISPPPWMRNPDLIHLLDLLNNDGINARMVGGCIRNYFYSEAVYDIDIACKLHPDKTSEILKMNGIRVIPTGINHGTITAHINQKNYEITALRRDVETDGRHAKIEFSSSWVEDASRRDFTMNALYADRDGSIYDPLGNGFSDLQNHSVKFIDDAEKRIGEDALRILRFFRFFAKYNEGNPDDNAYNACIKMKDTINNLSSERVYDELFKILNHTSAARALSLMQSANIFNIKKGAPLQLESLIKTQILLQKPCVVTRYYISSITNKYIKNNKQIDSINQLNEFINGWDEDLKYSLYRYDRDIVTQGLLVLKASGNPIDDMQVSDSMNLKIPRLPIIADDIMRHFKMTEGPNVGQKIREAETIWIESNFKLSAMRF